MKADATSGLRRRSSVDTRPRVAVVGAGIVGLANAWAAARRGARVLLFERHERARGASVRNFGMVWPIGQPNGPLHRTALRSRALWLQMLDDAGMWSHPCGSLHLAYRSDELSVLAEFARLAPALGYDCALLAPEEALHRSPAARREGLLGALWSGSEMCVDPREIIAGMPGWLADRFGVELHFGTAIDRAAGRWVASTAGERWIVDRVVIATGSDFQALHPDAYALAGFRRCKLQMMRTPAQPGDWRLGPLVAGGLTLGHYNSFAVCKTLTALKRRIADETPELGRHGIHVMAAQNGRGEVVLGDSHEYDEDSPFDKAEIDDLILRELGKLIDLPDWRIAERWHGTYVRAPDVVQYAAEIEPRVHACIASGGAGMTMSFGFADEQWTAWMGSPGAESARAGGVAAAATGGRE